jgi:cellulose synthase/poly-beta-1,6-N-acetylglucosamine synthase-like glycosyltransferase
MAYYIIVALFALIPRQKVRKAKPATRFAVLIAARNEERVIGRLIQSLRRQRYPKELFDIYVFPNNCTDNTEAAAIKAGAVVIKPDVPVTCKGDVLGYACSNLPEGYDAVCVFDADNIADENFLAVCNDYFLSGAKIVKGCTEALNPYDSWIAGCYAIYHKTMSIFYNRARSNLNLSAKLVGTAFAVSLALLNENGGWRTETLTEDCEFAADMAILGEKVWWAPEAVSYDEQPNSFRLSFVQRRRWISGIMDVAHLKLTKLISSETNFFQRIDTAMQLVYPYISLIAAIGGYVAIAFCKPSFLLVSLLLNIIGMILGAALIALIFGYRRKKIIKSVIAFPLFVLSWLPIQAISAFFRVKDWHPIEHGAAHGEPRPHALRSGLTVGFGE